MEKARLRKIERKTASEESITLANRTKEAEHIIEADMLLKMKNFQPGHIQLQSEQTGEITV